LSLGFISALLSPSSANPAAVTSRLITSGSMRCRDWVSRVPEPAAATWPARRDLAAVKISDYPPLPHAARFSARQAAARKVARTGFPIS
jgi:hypothetical protein